MKKLYPIALVVVTAGVFFAVNMSTKNNNKSTPSVKGVSTNISTTSDTTEDIQVTQTNTDSDQTQTSGQTADAAVSTTTAPHTTTAILAAVTTTPSNPANPVVPTLPVVVTPTPVVTPPATLVAPTISITAPADAATVSGTVAVTVLAADDKGVTQVRYSVDGAANSLTTTVAPYSFTWNTVTVANGVHTVSATVTDTDNQSTTTVVSVTVNNVAVVPVTPGNLIPNPSVETATVNLPSDWSTNTYGTTDAAFTYEATGHTGGHSLKTTITTVTAAGGADWYFTPVAVTAGGTYKYSNWYKSDVATEIDVAVTLADGTTQYYYMTVAPASANWSQVTGSFQMPANAVTATVFQVLTGVGSVQTDDFSLTSYTPLGFAYGMVSLTFDDSWLSQYTNGLPLLQKYGLTATAYALTSTEDYPDYMTAAMIQTMYAAGIEIAAHTVHHCDLTGVQTDDPTVCPTPISAAQVNSELVDSKTGLQTMTGAPVTDFATPYGAYSADVIAAIKAAGYESHRSTDVGFNSADAFDPYNIKVQNITNTTTVADVQAWVDQAIANKTWLVIVYHEVATAPADPTYAVTPTDLDLELAYIKQTGVAVATVHDALQVLTPQVVATP